MGPSIAPNYFALILVVIFVSSSKQDGLGDFVRTKMSNYTTWLKANNLDPSPLVSGPSSLWADNSVVKMDCNLSNHGVRGFSDELNVYGVLGSACCGGSGYFQVSFGVSGNIAFHGNYVANGTIQSTTPIEAEGSWYVQVPSFYASLFDIYFSEMTPGGFLNVTGHVPYAVGFDDGHEVFFENLLDQEAAAGFEDAISDAMFGGFEMYFGTLFVGTEHPLGYLFLKYWQEILAETTMEDIRGFTAAPPTTTEPTTEYGPCHDVESEYPDGLAYLKNTYIVDKSVEQTTMLDSNGVAYVVTRSTIVTRRKKEV